MKNIRTYVLLLVTLSAACKKNNPYPEETDRQNTLSIIQAQKWYQSQPALQAKYPADWNAASIFHTPNSNGWLLPLPGQPEMNGLKIGYRALAISKDLKTSTLSANVLDIIPDALTLQRNAEHPTGKFTGTVMVYDQQEKLQNGYLISEGVQTGIISPDTTLRRNNELHYQPKTKKQVSGSGKTSIFIIMATSHWETYSFVDGAGVFTVYSFKVTDYYTTGGSSTPYYGGGGTYEYEPPHSGGPGGGKTTVPKPSNLPGAQSPKVDPKKMTDCFGSIADQGASMKIKVLVQEAFPGTSFNMGPNSFGHVALALTKSNGSQSITQVIGFYPTGSGTAKFNSPSQILNNGGVEYNISATYTLTAAKFTQVLAYINNPPTQYDAENFNCTNFAFEAMKAGGINLPDPTVTVGVSGPGGAAMAMTPAGLAQGYRDMKAANPNSSITENTTNAPQSKGECK